MDGLVFQKNSENTVIFCVVERLTDEIKKAMRDDLSRICFGERKSLSGKSIYSYERTIVEFVKRYKTKSEDIKIGMLGELLCHVMLPRFYSHLRPASAYFNAEESSVKKGFDIILYSQLDDSIWFTEVKAGECGKKNATQ